MIYVVADIHSDKTRIQQLEERAYKKYGSAPGAGDILLVCGDLLGPVGNNLLMSIIHAIKNILFSSKVQPYKRGEKEDREFVSWLERKPYRVISIHGNHDSAAAMRRFITPSSDDTGQPLEILSNNVVYLKSGTVYNLEVAPGRYIKMLALGEAYSHLYRFHKNNKKTRNRFSIRNYLNNLKPEEINQVDLVLSHDGPASKLGLPRILYGDNPITLELDNIECKLDYTMWLYGHHHTDRNKYDKIKCLYNDIVLLQ